MTRQQSMREILTITLTMALSMALSSPAGAVDSPAKCTATKYKALGKGASALLRCWSKAAKLGGQTDWSCDLKASWKISGVAKGDRFGTCYGETNMFTATTRDLEDRIVDRLYLDADTITPDRCAAAKLGATGKYFAAVMKAESYLFVTTDVARYNSLISKAQSKLAQLFDAAESYPCRVASAPEDVFELVDANRDLVNACLVDTGECVVDTGSTAADTGSGWATTRDSESPLVDDPIGFASYWQVETPAPEGLEYVDEYAMEIPGFDVARAGYDMLDVLMLATLPTRSLAYAATVAIDLHANQIPAGRTISDVAIFFDGNELPDCTAVADPDAEPCVDQRSAVWDYFLIGLELPRGGTITLGFPS